MKGWELRRGRDFNCQANVWETNITGKSGCSIANMIVSFSTAEEGDHDKNACISDGNVISAAPEMLEALIDSTLYIEMKIDGRKCNHTIDVCYCKDMAYLSKCIIAIEKATGNLYRRDH